MNPFGGGLQEICWYNQFSNRKSLKRAHSLLYLFLNRADPYYFPIIKNIRLRLWKKFINIYGKRI